MSMKKRIAAISAAALVAVSAAIGTYAWFTSSDSITNTINMAHVDATIQEIEWKDSNGENLRIGDTVAKDPTVTANQGDIYFKIEMTVTDKNGKEITDQTVLDYLYSFMYYDPNGKLEEGKSYTQAQLTSLGLKHYNESAFDKDGLTFTYKTSSGYTLLKSGKSANLFTTICVPSDITKSEWITYLSPLEDCTISFEVKAVLADSFGADKVSTSYISDALNY